MILKQQATVYLSPTRGRRFFGKMDAIKSEARARLDNEHNSDWDGTTPGESWKTYDLDGILSNASKALLDDEIAIVTAEYNKSQEALKS